MRAARELRAVGGHQFSGGDGERRDSRHGVERVMQRFTNEVTVCLNKKH
jgi:hypothetical protein